MMSDSGSGLEPSPVQNISAQYTKLKRQYQQILDRWTPHILQRWLATAGLLTIFMLRILISQGVSTLQMHFYLIVAQTPLTVVYWYVGLSIWRNVTDLFLASCPVCCEFFSDAHFVLYANVL